MCTWGVPEVDTTIYLPSGGTRKVSTLLTLSPEPALTRSNIEHTRLVNTAPFQWF